jgi:hypothetical protein
VSFSNVSEAMNEDLANFKAWYTDVLAALYPNRNAGIAELMLSLPLAKRYLPRKNEVGPEEALTDACMTSLIAILPALRAIATACQFWAVCRHGFLHQAALSAAARGGGVAPRRLAHS